MKLRTCVFVSVFFVALMPAWAEIVRSAIGDKSKGVEGKIRRENIEKKQQFQASQKDTYDTDIRSPKSAAFSSDGRCFYINSLEDCKTVVYDALTFGKIAVVKHIYDPDGADSSIFAPLSGNYEFTHCKDGAKRKFQGKPVKVGAGARTLSLSPDGHRMMIVTSQGKSGGGGKSVNIYAINRFEGYDYDAELKKRLTVTQTRPAMTPRKKLNN